MPKVYYSLYDRLLHRKALERAFVQVRRANGAAGTDGQTVAGFGADLPGNIGTLVKELRGKTYRPQPVKRVTIPKPNGGERHLGIPAVRDRVVQQALLNIMQPIFDPDFHPSSYGYRPGRGCHDAIAKAALFIRRYDLQWVVDMDLSKCFDTLDHDLILQQVRWRIADGSILNLIRLFLTSGVMTAEGVLPTTTGSPQGGVISPLLANIYLDAFDQHTKERGLRIVRYADDILILTRSRMAAENALRRAAGYLESDLRLTVNREKTHITHASRGVKFLGVAIYPRGCRIQPGKVAGFKAKVKAITRRNSPVSVKRVMEELNPLLRGFANYFRIADCKSEFKRLMKWIRRRLRAKQLKLWKKPAKLHRRLRQLGYCGEHQAIKLNSWRNAACQLAQWALPNAWFKEMGLFDLYQVETGVLSKVG